MQPASEKSVLGNFDNAKFDHDGTVAEFFKKDGKYWVRTDGPDGKLADFEIRYTFGVAPLQQYLIELPGGRIQALGIAWDARPKDRGGQRWYHLYPGRKLTAGDPLHWTGLDQNWNYQCAWCHSTNLRKNFDQATKEFKTTWSEISVGCEACHGPASKHIAWAKSDYGERGEDDDKGLLLSLDERRNVTWPMGDQGQAARSVRRTSSKEIEMCAACHARRGQFSDKPKDVLRFFDAFRPSLLERDLYHVDGQQRDEVYTYASFTQSKMHAEGVTCSDCHNPHSGKVRLTGNATCTQCHAADRFDAPSHHHHASGTDAAQCVSCHAPTTVYMGVDPRHDHSFRIPRPDRTIILGTPNACNQCHDDQPAKWADDAIKRWFPSRKPGFQSFAEAFSRADLGAPGAQADLIRIAGDHSQSSIARASALARLGRLSSPQSLALAEHALSVDDPLVQLAAIPVLASADPETRRRLLVPLLTNRSRLVRMDAARALAGAMQEGLPADARAAFDAAIAEYVEAQKFNAERPEAHGNLGALFRDQGKIEEARAAFAKATEIDPTFFAAAISLADLVRTSEGEAAAEKILTAALSSNPNSGAIQHAIGLSLIRQKRTTEAMSWLAKAVENAPETSRFAYVYAVALHDTGKPREAIDVLKNALARHPYDRDILMVLASYEIEANELSSAWDHAKLLGKLEPGRPDVLRMLNWLRQKQQASQP